MSTFWSLWVMVLVAVTAVGSWWLLQSNRKVPPGEGATTGHEWDGIEELNNPLPYWWYMMFILSLLFLVALMIVVAGIGFVIGVVNMTGVGLWFAEQVLSVSGNDLALPGDDLVLALPARCGRGWGDLDREQTRFRQQGREGFLAGFTLGHARGLPAHEALGLGAAMASAACMTPATELCRRKDVDRLFDARVLTRL